MHLVVHFLLDLQAETYLKYQGVSGRKRKTKQLHDKEKAIAQYCAEYNKHDLLQFLKKVCYKNLPVDLSRPSNS